MQKLTTIFIFIATLLFIGTLIGLVLILNKLDPNAAKINPYLLYGDVFLLIGSFSLLIGFYLRQTLGIREFAIRHLAVSARQGAFLGLLVAVSLMLMALDLFSLWNALFLVGALIFLESYFLLK